MPSPAREYFSSRTGFIMAATGSAVGLGNIWGFPTQAGNNGGAAFVLVYVVFTLTLAYPALMAELVIGRHTRSSMVKALPALSARQRWRSFGRLAGICGILISSLILAFYAIVAGWMVANILPLPASALGLPTVASWAGEFSRTRNLLFCLIFSALTVAVIARGVHRGIERWSNRLMPTLLILIAVLALYVFTQPGAITGLKVYLLPDFGALTRPQLLLSAMGQAFFSLSLGVGTMLIYGSYLRSEENLPVTGALVAGADTGVALLAGLFIIPAVHVAAAQGVAIYDDTGALVAGPDLILQTLPSLFKSLGISGVLVSVAFFCLMVIAALTSSISMLEVPVAYLIERWQVARQKAALLAGGAIFLLSVVIILDFDRLFGLVIDITTKYSQPALGGVLCVFAGWVLHRDRLLKEIQSGYPGAEHSWFWKIWPFYIRFVCPTLIAALVVNSLIA